MTSSFKKLIYPIFVIGFLAQGYYGLIFDGEDYEGDNIFDLFGIINEIARNEFHIKVVPGTNQFKSALHFEKGIQTYIHSFPSGGIPREFSFECVFRTEQPPIESWHLVALTDDLKDKCLMHLAIDPNSKTIELHLPISNGEMKLVSFEGPKIFDDSWHKIKLRLTNDSVGMWVDCERVLDLEGREEVRLEREQIDSSDGFLKFAVGVSYGQTVSVDIQQMIMSSEVNTPDETTCEELPKPISKLTEKDKTKTANETCPEQCPAGPVGPPGPDGLPGPIGFTGLPGLKGSMGRRGPMGETGFSGEGEHGQKGEQGQDGLPGYPGPNYGSKGERGDNGMRGEKGDYGLPGSNGIPGRPGLRGLPSPAVDQSELENLCLGYVRDYIKEHESELIGPPGPDGLIGITGRKGDIGYPGMPGLDGYTLHSKGQRGSPGPAGPAGKPGKCPECYF